MNSPWKVGSLRFEDFAGLLGEEQSRIEYIVSADLNLCPRPWEVMVSQKRINPQDLFTTLESAIEQAKQYSHPSKLVFWEMDAEGFQAARNDGWFETGAEPQVNRPEGWSDLGMDIINGEGVSELWDVFERGFWQLDPELVRVVNQNGLISKQDVIERIKPELPLNPLYRWVSIWRAWTPVI
jgi:hypothetical protein